MRADQLLVERGHAASRSQAQRLIAAGVQWRLPGAAWQAVRKNGEELPDYAELQLQDAAEARYVSRGGLKLEGALLAVGLDVTGLRCLDVGQSTGGFSDCLLQHGAASITGIDFGQAQLHPRLRPDARVTAHEKLNARDAAAVAAALGEHDGFDLLVGDLSFISQTLVWPALLPQLKPGGQLLMLVKPQFELQPAQIGKGGIVRDARLYAEVEQRMRDCCNALNVELLHWLDSPIAGGDGNREFFVHGRKA